LTRAAAHAQAKKIDAAEMREIVRRPRGWPKKFTGMNYTLQFALPDFRFRVATAYAFLRHDGIDVDKAGFIGTPDRPVQPPDVARA
jgi:hypothetical protein